MAFSDTNAALPAGPTYADNLHLKVWSGEVLKTFNTQTVLKSRVRVRTITSGSAVQVPDIGKVSAAYHTPGQVILGQAVNHGGAAIKIDDLLIADTFVSNWEEAVNHYEVRSEYTLQMGDSLAQAYDQHLFAIAAKAARSGSTGPVPEMGPATMTKLGATPSMADITYGIYTSAAALDEKDVPKDGRTIFVTPSLYWDLIQDGSFLDRDFGNVNGSQSGGSIMRVAGFEVVPSNNFALNFGEDSIEGKRGGTTHAEYTVDNSTAVAMVMQRQALGSVHLMDLATEKDYQVERQGTLVISRMATGHGVLRPECIDLLVAEEP